MVVKLVKYFNTNDTEYPFGLLLRKQHELDAVKDFQFKTKEDRQLVIYQLRSSK